MNLSEKIMVWVAAKDNMLLEFLHLEPSRSVPITILVCYLTPALDSDSKIILGNSD